MLLMLLPSREHGTVKPLRVSLVEPAAWPKAVNENLRRDCRKVQRLGHVLLKYPYTNTSRRGALAFAGSWAPLEPSEPVDEQTLADNEVLLTKRPFRNRVGYVYGPFISQVDYFRAVTLSPCTGRPESIYKVPGSAALNLFIIGRCLTIRYEPLRESGLYPVSKLAQELR